jgi:uncharacterized phage protein gp47/JayE
MTLAVQVTAAGISGPTYADVLTTLQSQFRAIYGSNAYIEPDSQDGQFLALLATAIHDVNDAAIAVFNSFSPTYSQGAQLSSLVKLNGLARLVSTNSSAVLLVGGTAGTVITNGVARDTNGNFWNLPATVTIGSGGTVTVTAYAQKPGAISAPAGSISKINTPTLGWQTVSNTADAIAGNPVESDASLRRRQAVSTSLAATAPVDGVLAALANLTGVKRVKVYENATGSTDANGIPARAISAVVEGGSVTEIATTIGNKKTPGTGTAGATAGTVTIGGLTYAINFDVLTFFTIKVNVSIHSQGAWVATTADAIKLAVSNYVNALGIGEPVVLSKLFPPAYLNGADPTAITTYTVTAITQAISGNTLTAADVPISFNKAAACLPSDVTITFV